jgi:hypothetical protein
MAPRSDLASVENHPALPGPAAVVRTGVLHKLYNQMVLEKAQIKAEPMIQIGGLKKKTDDKEMAIAE